MAHARVYNDYVIERFSPYFHRLAPTAPIPITDVADAVAEIERVAAAGFRAVLLPATPPRNYYTRELDPVWAAAEANGVQVFFHTQTGGVKVNDTEAVTLKVVLERLSSLVGAMDKCWVTGIGQDPDWWLGKWDDSRPANDQPDMAQLFR